MASLAVAAVFATPSDFLTAPLHRRGSHVVTNSSSVSGCLLTKRGDSRRIGQRHRAASLAIRCSSGKGLKYVSVPSLYFVSSIDLASALSPELKSTIDKVVQSQKVVLFMKGTKEFPQCGFSNTVVQVLNSLNVPFDTLNILENEILRHGMKEYSNWPTFPQLYIDGEFFGGCDIVVEAYKAGQLQEDVLIQLVSIATLLLLVHRRSPSVALAPGTSVVALL
ncbi:hypothetical protein ZIOFF_009971 [Zingiber officinale]|uniref:Glutaredoxin domain-containing protein n=1 Tax=Zingiber officinale TaxID=94328 RepID=A0A8J5LY05_ZINOF|nr:hypothetical protein ZIOFF_009971 [Zingiber officinale]